MTTPEFIIALVGSSAVTSLGTILVSRKKTKAETDQVVNEVMGKVLENVKFELERTHQQVSGLLSDAAEDKKKISALQAEIDQIEEKHEECEFSNSMLIIELEGLRRMIAEKTIPLEKVKVAILDDNKLVTYLFEHRLSRISLLDVRTFNDVDSFMAYIPERPDMLILDYHLGRGVTIEAFLAKILQQPGYNPKVVIITADRSPELREALSKLGVWRFFVKEGPYVNMVTKQVMDYIENLFR